MTQEHKRLGISKLLLWEIVLVVLGLVFAVWLIRPEAQVDRSFLSGSPCAAPCWQGITPGITTRSQAMAILTNSPYIQRNSIKQAGTPQQGGCLWEWRASGRRLQPSLSWQNDIVDNITLGLTYDVTVEQVIDKFGIPDALGVGRGGLPEHQYWIVDLYYPKDGLQIKAYMPEGSNVIESSTEVSVVEFYAPTSLDDRILNVYGSGTDADRIVAHIKGLLRPWRGYGDLFKVYYRSPDELYMKP